MTGVLLATVLSGMTVVACHRPMLAEATVRGAVDGLAITYGDTMGDSYKLVRIEMQLDAEPIYFCVSDGERTIDAQEPILIYDGPVAAGRHSLGVKLDYRGNGYGVFAYLKSYHFVVRGRHDFAIAPGSGRLIEAVSFERGGVSAPIEDRPALRFDERPLFDGIPPTRTGCRMIE
jgi:hypothetical protein